MPQNQKNISTYNKIVSAICQGVRSDLQYESDYECDEFMDLFHYNTEPYQYDETDDYYTPEYLDQPNCPSTPEEVEEQFQSIFSPYGIQYVQPQIEYTPAYEPGYPNGIESSSWTIREPNINLTNEMADYIVDNFFYKRDIPLTTYPNTKITMHLDASTLPNIDVTTHEFKHVVDLPILQNLLYIYGLNEFRKVNWSRRLLFGKEYYREILKSQLDSWVKENNRKLYEIQKANEGRLDSMENERTLGQHCFNNIPLLKEVYDDYLPRILEE